ncbi:MAG: hypothetical protein CMJ64_11455 [Planctomycetaceae bacterium]|nr:hypothetical protein [Planctomycetaceae bacterium]
MTRHWEYPIYLIKHGGGYASIVDSTVDEPSKQSLVVCCEEEAAIGFMAACGIMGVPRELNNDREFGWLLQRLQTPVKGVVFDPSASVEEQDSACRISVPELLEKHLVADNSPWNYPVYVVAQDEGFVSIDAADSDGRTMNVIGFFASEERIETYLEAVGETGTACAMANIEEARSFLKGIASQAAAIAINPTVADGQRTAKHCLAIETLLEKYLVPEGKPRVDE